MNSQATSHGDFMYAFLGCYLATVKSRDVTSFSPCTDLSREQQDLQHLMSEQIDLRMSLK